MNVTFDKSYQPWLAAAADSRSAKDHVFVDPDGWLVATDGHIMAAVPCEITTAPEGFSGCLLGAKTLQAFAKAVRKLSFVPLEIDLERETVSSFDLTEHLPLERAASFPQWRRIIPAIVGMDDEPTPPPYLCLDPWLMSRLALAIGCDKNVPIPFLPNAGERPMVFANGSALGLLMPGAQVVAKGIRPHVHELTGRLSTAYGTPSRPSLTRR